MEKPHPQARPTTAPGKGSRWQWNVAKVQLTDGTEAECSVYETDQGGAPPGRFFWNGSWWTVPYEAMF